MLTEPFSPLPPRTLLKGGEFVSRLAGLLDRPDFPGRAEFARLRPAMRFLMIALAAWIGLIVLATVFAVAAVEMSTISVPGWFSARASASTRNEIRPSAGFEAILQRPLFSRSRQAAAIAVGDAPPSPVADDNAGSGRHTEGRVHQRCNCKGIFDLDARSAWGLGSGG